MEAVGNFVLVLAFGIAIATHSWFAPLLIAAPLVAMVYSGNRLPYAYFNPSLTFAMLMRRRVAIRDALAFLLIQSGSGLLAAMLVCAMVGPKHLAVTAATMKGSTLVVAFALELMVTSALCVVAFDLSRSSRCTADDYNSWPIALGVVASAVATGAATISWPTLWIYLVSQLLSGIAATITFVSLADER